MSTVIFSESKFMTVSTIPKNITDNFMDKILEYGPDNLSWHALIHAQIKFNSRANNQNQIWYDLLPVYIGLPDWIEFENEIKEHNLKYLRVPVGFLCDLLECSKHPVGITLTYPNDTAKSLQLLHTTTDVFKEAVYIVDAKTQSEFYKNFYKEKYQDDFNLNPCRHVFRKKQLVVDELHILKYEGYRVRDFFVALEYFFSISEGAPGFYEYWYGDVEEYPGHKEELIDYYRGLDLQKLYDRACVVFEDFDDDYYCMHHFQVVATLAYLENKERVFPYEDCEEEVERCSIHYLLEILARSPIYPEEEVDDE